MRLVIEENVKGNWVSFVNVSVFVVIKLGVLCGSFCISGWIEILNLLSVLKYMGKRRFFLI